MRDRVLLICIRTRLHALFKLVVAVTSSHASLASQPYFSL